MPVSAPIGLIGTSVSPKYLSNPGKVSPRSVRPLPRHGWPPPARCFFLYCIFQCRLLRHISTANAGSSLPVLQGLHLPPHKRDRVRTQLSPPNGLVSDQGIGPKSTTLDLCLMVCLPTLPTRSSTVSSPLASSCRKGRRCVGIHLDAQSYD